MSAASSTQEVQHVEVWISESLNKLLRVEDVKLHEFCDLICVYLGV